MPEGTQGAGEASVQGSSGGHRGQAGEGELRGRSRKVAVVGVHGIARHPAGETANAMADLLLALPAAARGGANSVREYGPFREVDLRIPLQRVKVMPVLEDKEPGFASFVEQSARFAKELALEGPAKSSHGGSQAGNKFTGVLLNGYCGAADSNTYVTTRLEGKRKKAFGDAKTSDETGVDIYEVLWADLAHPESSLVGFFLSLFSLMLHLASLSRLAVESGSAWHRGDKVWWTYLGAQGWAVRILQVFLPLFKVLLLVVLLSGIPAIATDVFNGTAGLGFAVLLGVLGGVGLVFAVYLKWKTIAWPLWRSPWLWGVTIVFPGLIGGGIAFGLAHSESVGPQLAGSLLCWVCIGTPIVGFILSKYEGYRNGVQFWGWVSYVTALLLFVVLFRWAHREVALVTFWMVEIGTAAIRISWLAMSGLAMVALLLGSVVCFRERDPEKKARLKAAVRTSRFALAMPTVFFLLVTPLLWAAMFGLADWARTPFFLVTGHENDGNYLFQLFIRFHLIPDAADPVFICGDYLKYLLGWGLGYQIPITLAMLGLAVFLLLWWIAPSALVEGFVQRSDKVPPRSSENRQTKSLGSWLSRGLDATKVITALFWAAFFLAFPAVYALSFSEGGKAIYEVLRDATMWMVEHPFLAMSGVIVAGIAKYGSSVLSTILDVDTYLRATPDNGTPRAKIFERYVSTLRYVASYRDEHGRGYDAVVIVAHSLGSLISGDILRYLQEAQGDPKPGDRDWHESSRYDPALSRYGFAGEASRDKIELKLLTMGSPIRQLLNRFFPYLYDWVRPVPDNSLWPLPLPASEPGEHEVSDLPDPKGLGLAQWVNTYRSGDYVGRSLWLQEWYMRNLHGDKAGQFPEKIEMLGKLTGQGRTARVEMCIGAGAHTRYWDDTAPDVSETLDAMIAG